MDINTLKESINLDIKSFGKTQFIFHLNFYVIKIF
jgi:hypothetical protein